MIALAWRDRAECAGQPLDWFYPSKITDRTTTNALALCRRCEVRDDCLRDALRVEGAQWSGRPWGIRGGLTPEQRGELITRNRKRSA